MKKYLFTVTGLCILMLIVTLMRPSTRGLFLLHLEMIFRTPVQFSAARMITGVDPESNLKDQPWGVAQKKRMKEAASKFPNDVPVQIALAVDAGEMASSGETLRLVQAYKQLSTRYPQSPSAQAALIREMSRKAVRLKRNEENVLIGYPPEPLPPPSKSEDLIAYDAAAARGERYDPKNAFFPFMRASCLFAANQDSEAIKCLKRAAEKPNWNDYSSDYINGSCRLAEITYGDKTTIRHIAAFITNPYPHFTNTRAVARVATYKAVEAEARGNRAEGKAIRHALISCGDKMRANSNAIGTLVSEAIEVTSMTRPSGASALKDIEKMKNQMRINNAHDNFEKARVSSKSYITYLKSQGWNNEADWVANTILKSAESKEIIMLATKNDNIFFPYEIWDISRGWIISQGLLMNAVFILFIGALAGISTRRIKQGKLPLVILLVCFGLIIYIAIRSVPWPIFRDLGNVRIEMDDRYNPYGLDGSPNFSFLNLSRVLLFSGLFSLLGVLAMLISVAVYLRKKRIAFVTGLPQYTGLVSNYFAVHILLLYFISLPFLAVIEAKHKAQFDKQVQHEGRAMAQSVNKKWPE